MSTTQGDLVQTRVEPSCRQARWEAPKAIAMILLGAAAIAASARLADGIAPTKPQVITIHLDTPLSVQLRTR